MNHKVDHFFSGQECSEYEPILSSKYLKTNNELAEEICAPEHAAEDAHCDSCIYFNSYECKIFK